MLPNDYSEVLPHIYVIRIKNLVDREGLRTKLLNDGIQTGIHYQPNHALTFFNCRNPRSTLPRTEAIFKELLTLPLHPDLGETDIDFTSQKLKFHLKEH